MRIRVLLFFPRSLSSSLTSFTSSSSSSSPHHLLHVFLIVIVSPKTQTNLRDAERERHTHRERDSRERRTPTKRATPTRILLPSVVFAFPSLETQLFSERDARKVKESSEIPKNGRKRETKKHACQMRTQRVLLLRVSLRKEREDIYKRAQKK